MFNDFGIRGETHNDKNTALQKNKEEREKRQLHKKKNESAVTLQKYLRGYLSCKR